jgi:hypothetical protein
MPRGTSDRPNAREVSVLHAVDREGRLRPSAEQQLTVAKWWHRSMRTPSCDKFAR